MTVGELMETLGRMLDANRVRSPEGIVKVWNPDGVTEKTEVELALGILKGIAKEKIRDADSFSESIVTFRVSAESLEAERDVEPFDPETGTGGGVVVVIRSGPELEIPPF